jgi:hypothetical protein
MRTMRISVFGSALCCALLVIGASAQAGEPLPKAHLAYQVDAALVPVCPNDSVFRKHVALRMGYDPFVASGAAIAELRVRITAVSGAFEGEVALVDANGTVLGRRVLLGTPKDCDELVSNAAFVASLAIDPSVRAGTSRATTVEVPAPPPSARAPEPSPRGARTLERSPVKVPVVAPAKRIEQASSHAFSIGLSAGATWSIAPLPAPTFAAQVRYRKAFWSLALIGRADLPVAAPLGGATIETSVLAAGLAAYGHVGLAPRLELALGIAAYGGALRGQSQGISNPKRDVTPYATVGPSVALALLLPGPLDLILTLDAPVVLSDTELRVDERVLWSTPKIGLLSSLGARWSFR